jgi:hypothetical protein
MFETQKLRRKMQKKILISQLQEEHGGSVPMTANQ